MKNNVWFVIACVLFFFVGYGMNNTAISFPRYKVAVVDIQSVMAKSPEIKTLRDSQNKQITELNTLISKAQNEILNEKDRQKALKMEEKYRNEIETKRNTIDEEYNKKIAQITAKIRDCISTEAKKSNYNLVLPTGMVISGGEDITQNVIKNFK